MVHNAKAVAQNPADQNAAGRWRGANQEVRSTIVCRCSTRGVITGNKRKFHFIR